MKKYKKIVALCLAAALAIGSFTACGAKDERTVSEIVKVATLNGPTGMAMVQLTDMTDKYEVTAYQAPTDINAKIISGEVDVAAVPSNLAAVLYNKTEGQVVAVSPIALGMLHILGNDIAMDQQVDADGVSVLKGKTIVASGQGGTPEYVLQKILESNGLELYKDVNVEWLANHTDVNQKLLTQKGTIAMVPEPFVSAAMTAGKGAVADLFDLNELWKEATGEELPMGVLVARKAFVEEREADLAVLLKDLQDSVNFVNGDTDEAAQLIVDKKFLANAELAKAAIPNCNIVLYAGDKAKEGAAMLKTFYQTLFEMNPASIGGKLPDENLYY